MPIARIPIDLTWSGASGSPGVNVWHGRFDDGAPLSGDLQDLTEILQDFYQGLAGHFPTSMQVRWSGTASGVGADTETEWQSPTWTVDGTGGGGYLPPFCMQYVNWRAATGGRSGRGRTFIGPLIPAVQEGDGSQSPVYRSGLQTEVDELVSASLSDTNGALGIWSREDGVFRDFVSGQVPDKFAVLRSRRD